MNDLGNACSGFNDDELGELKSIATLHSEAGSLIIKLSSWVGDKADSLFHKVPADWQHLIEEATDLALKESYRVAFATQPEEDPIAHQQGPIVGPRRNLAQGRHEHCRGSRGARRDLDNTD